MRSTSQLVALVALVCILSSSVSAQTAALPTGAQLAALLPASLPGARQTAQNNCGRFATATYVLAEGGIVALQFHEVSGAGSEAYLRSVCPRFAPIAGHQACVTPRSGATSVSWVLDDTLQVIMSAPDEATVMRLAGGVDLEALVRLLPRAH